MTSTSVYFHERFLDHDTGVHPESAARLVIAKRILEHAELDLAWRTPASAAEADIGRVHDQAYIDHVRELAQAGGGRLDWDTVVSPASYDAALLAAGAGIEAVQRALSDKARAFSLCRPPGHHAMRSRGMGFCLFNNIAVAAAYALEELGLERILVFDWDVHHGNGTQDSFYHEPRVLFVSLHQEHHYPGTGSPSEVGVGPGKGFTANVPLPVSHGDGAVKELFTKLLEPLVHAYQPQLLLVSAGYDGQFRDPLGGLSLSEEVFGWMAFRLTSLASELQAAGPVCFLEGGYNPEMMGRSIARTLHGLAGEEIPLGVEIRPADEQVVGRTLEYLAPYWPGALPAR